MTSNQSDSGSRALPHRTADRPARPRRQAAATRTVVPRTDHDRPCPLSAGQRQMWSLQQLNPRSPAYLMPWALRVTGPLDHEALRLAWQDLAARHEVLRTFYTDAGAGSPEEVVQTVAPTADPAWQEIDLTPLPAPRREERAREIANWVRRRPFDLTVEQPLRVTLIKVNDLLHVMVVTVHHIACDGSGQIDRELGELYEARVTGRTARLPDVAVQYADFAIWEHAGLTEGRLEPHLDYWRSALAGVGELPLPLDQPRPSRPDARGGFVTVEFSAGTSDAVRALAAARRTTPFTVLLTAFHAALGRIAETDDVTVGLPCSLRTLPELADTVGYLVNTVVVRAHPRAGVTFGELLDEVRAGLLEGLDHRAVPFAQVVNDLNPERTPGVNPLFQAMFDMPAHDDDSLRLPGLVVEKLDLAQSPVAKFDVNLHAAVLPDGRFTGRLDYAAAVIEEGTAAEWAECWRSVVEDGVRDPGTPPADPRDAYAADERHPTRQNTGGPRVEPSEAAPRTPPPSEPREVRPHHEMSPERTAALVAQAWAEVLGVDDDPDPDENFFDAGGDSLRAVTLAGRLRGAGLDVAAADLFAFQSVAELVAALSGRGGIGPMPDPVEPYALIGSEDRAALPADVVDAYPLAAVQLGMLVELHSRPLISTYQDTTCYLVRDDAPLRVALLKQAMQTVVDRHEALRTSFDLSGYSVPLQLVHRDAEIAVRSTTMADGEPEDWLSVLKEFCAAERLAPMDVASAPLIRVHAHARPDRTRWWLSITECHPILEGWSFNSMIIEALTLYRTLRDGERPTQPEPVPFRYADYIAAEAKARRSEEDRAYWRRTVEGCSEPALPVGWQDLPDVARRRDQYVVDLRDLDVELRRLAEQTHTSHKAVLLALHVTVMRIVTGSESFFTGLACDARPEAVGADRVYGMYLNTLPFRMPEGRQTWGDLVRATYDRLTELWPHRVYPMPLLQQEFGCADRMLNVIFNYLDFHQIGMDLVDGELIYNDNVNEFGLHVFTWRGGLCLNVDNHLLSPDAAPVLLALYRLVAEEMALGPDGPVHHAELRLAADQPGPGQPVRWAGGVGVGGVRVAAALRQLASLSPTASPGNRTVPCPERVAAGVTARVLGPDRLPVPRGVPGDLWVGGADRALPDAHRTGLAARMGLDGALEILGVADLDPPDAVLWPGGSATVLLQIRELIDRHPSVRDSRVLVRPDSQETSRLTAYVRSAGTTEVDVASVRRWLIDRKLPRRLIPESWITIEEWPLRPDGALLVDDLPEPVARSAEEADQRPWDDVFDKLLREALDPALDTVADVPLAERGLDSLGSVGLLVAIEQAYDITIMEDLPLMEIMRTPRTLWEAVDRIRQEEDSAN
ncbi:condensation domain-containing protein [Streptomyces sp. NPDC057137]|uniref:condensation domain-containing protein n=1 Tax=Streptomyces sp. NPDC057137 TaxID=3346030 RepID=UPI00362F3D33